MKRPIVGVGVVAPLVVALLIPATVSTIASAQGGAAGIYGPGTLSPLTVSLGCRVENEKVLVITNTSSNPVSAGTAVAYDALRKPDRIHYGRVVRIGYALAPATRSGLV